MVYETYRRLLVQAAVLAAFAVVAASSAGRTSPLAATRTVPVRDATGTEYQLIVDDRGATFIVTAPARSQVEAAPGTSVSSAIYPSFAAAEGVFLPSLELCRWKGLAFEDGALAVMEAKVEETGGAAALPSGRTGFLVNVAAKLKQSYEATADRPTAREPFGSALAFVATALALARADGKVPPELGLPADLVTKAGQDRDNFLKTDARAKAPAGRYTWDEALGRLYVTGCWLGRDFDGRDDKAFAAAVALAWTVSSDAELAKGYKYLLDGCNALVGKTPKRATVDDYVALLAGRDAPTVLKEVGTVRALQEAAKEKGDVFVFLPTLTTPEVEAVRRVVAGGAKADAGWAAALVAAVPTGSLPMPASDGSWYDYANYAWAALVAPADLPEAKKLRWDDGYKKRLGESFRFAFDQVRTRAAAPPAKPGDELEADIVPDFRLEPAPEYYLRMARAYGRLEKALQATLTAPTMAATPGRREKGSPADASLAVEAAAYRELFFGLYLLACADVGMTPALAYGDVTDRAAAAARAATWLNVWKTDPDMAADIRTAWPLGPADAGAPAKGTIYRCVLGVRAVDLEVKYDAKPATTLLGTSKTVQLHVKPSKYAILVPVVVEVATAGEKALTQAEFRKTCDQHKTRDAIVAALKEYGKPAPAPPPPPPAKPARKVDRGMLVLLGILAIFAFIVIIVLIAGRQRSLYS